MRRASRVALAGLLAAVTAGIALLLPGREPASMPAAAHEASDVGFRPMLVGGMLLLLGIGFMMGLAFFLYPGSMQDQAVPQPLPRFPAPQLQPNTQADMAAFHDRQMRQLNGTYWIDRPADRLHLPIGRAMEDVARRGIPDWPAR